MYLIQLFKLKIFYGTACFLSGCTSADFLSAFIVCVMERTAANNKEITSHTDNISNRCRKSFLLMTF